MNTTQCDVELFDRLFKELNAYNQLAVIISICNIKLMPQPLPYTTHKINVRTLKGATHWKKVRERVCLRVGNKCEVCGWQHPKRSVDCHEVWKFEGGVQKLVALGGICRLCHLAIHIGCAGQIGYAAEVSGHLSRVNAMSGQQQANLLLYVKRLHIERRMIPWQVDISSLEQVIDNPYKPEP